VKFVEDHGRGLARPATLRHLFARPGVVRLIGAHNPLGARLAERAGFDGVWSSGLEISASQGLPDTDLLTMSELLSVAGAMSAAVEIPVVADCDAGYGNALNVMHMVRRYERAGLTAVCMEDKAFPKVNSFVPGRQKLSSVAEFCGKIEAAKNAQCNPDLMVIARTEALIAGHDMEEALRRGEAYAGAGADAVLIHAKDVSPGPVLEFLQRWRIDLPVVVIPTTYHTITAAELGAAGAKMVIYANHGLRAGINAVREVFDAILREDRSTGIEERIAPLATVFDLQGMAKIKQDEKRFVRAGEPRTRAVVVPGGSHGRRELAAGSSAALSRLRATALKDIGVCSVLDAGPGPAVADAPAALADVPPGFADVPPGFARRTVAAHRAGDGMRAVLDPVKVVEIAEENGYGPFMGVPCSFLAPIISCLQDRTPDRYIAAANEGEAVAIAAGARLAGQRPVVMMQNSGLGNAVNPLTSLCHTLRLPVLLLVTWRGEPGTLDEPQHELMGQITPKLLTTMQIRHEILPDTEHEFGERLQVAEDHMRETGLPFAFVVPKGAISNYSAQPRRTTVADELDSAAASDSPHRLMLRTEAIAHVMRIVGRRALVVATTGKTARELERDWDRAGNLYVVGSMGCASSVALGVARYAPERQVIVLDGDGAALLRMEAMATIGRLAPQNLLHIVLDNEAYESTGGQPTGSKAVNFTEVAAACGYEWAMEVSCDKSLTAALAQQPCRSGPSMLRVRIAAWSDPELGRPALAPPAAAARFRSAVTS
jgi:phosphonopyruvate decarboxylase